MVKSRWRLRTFLTSMNERTLSSVRRRIFRIYRIRISDKVIVGIVRSQQTVRRFVFTLSEIPAIIGQRMANYKITHLLPRINYQGKHICHLSHAKIFHTIFFSYLWVVKNIEKQIKGGNALGREVFTLITKIYVRPSDKKGLWDRDNFCESLQINEETFFRRNCLKPEAPFCQKASQMHFPSSSLLAQSFLNRDNSCKTADSLLRKSQWFAQNQCIPLP
jgi:hypothetical protein